MFSNRGIATTSHCTCLRFASQVNSALTVASVAGRDFQSPKDSDNGQSGRTLTSDEKDNRTIRTKEPDIENEDRGTIRTKEPDIEDEDRRTVGHDDQDGKTIGQDNRTNRTTKEDDQGCLQVRFRSVGDANPDCASCLRSCHDFCKGRQNSPQVLHS